MTPHIVAGAPPIGRRAWLAGGLSLLAAPVNRIALPCNRLLLAAYRVEAHVHRAPDGHLAISPCRALAGEA